jgi:hypothetical protein
MQAAIHVLRIGFAAKHFNVDNNMVVIITYFVRISNAD